jgi:hypothetical protein
MDKYSYIQDAFKLHWYSSRSCRWVKVKFRVFWIASSPTYTPIKYRFASRTATTRVHLSLPVVMCLLVQCVVSRVWSACSELRSIDLSTFLAPRRPCCEFIYFGLWLQQGCVSVARNDGHAPRVWCSRQKRQDSSAVTSATSAPQQAYVPKRDWPLECRHMTGRGRTLRTSCMPDTDLHGLLGAVTARIRTACAPIGSPAGCGSCMTGVPCHISTNARE